MIRKLLSSFLLVLMSVWTMAETNMTSKITNPSFENDGFNGWVQSNMQTQSNSSFSKKAGSVYVEKWTGKGGAVGNASVVQTITTLPVGRYKLTVAAQNIQEDSPTATQTGAYIFANDERTDVGVTGDYSVEFTVLDGVATIGFKAENASGNWIAVDNFRLYQTGDARDEILEILTAAIVTANEVYGDGSGAEAEALHNAIQTATSVLNDAGSTSQQIAEQVSLLDAAVFAYRVANASETSPVDMTTFIVNPSFENDGFNGWTNTNMQLQSNDSFTLKDGTVYVERWTSSGNAVGDGSVVQTVVGIPEGKYRLSAVGQNIQESSPAVTKKGAYIFGEESRTAVGVRAAYSVDFITLCNEAVIGFVATNAQGNWIACDNFTLSFLGKDVETLKAELKARIDVAEALVGKKMRGAEQTALQEAIEAATERWNATGEQTYADVAKALRTAVNNAEASIAAYEVLAKAITEALGVQNGGNGLEEFNAAIASAQALYDSDTASNSDCEQMVDELSKAIFKYRLANGSGTVPKVKTDPRYARGCIEAFGRMTVSGIATSSIKEQGFCYSSTNPEPTVLDNRSTDYLEKNGRIYRMSMEPATIYYMRAYVITNTYAVGYGDVIKLSTLPMGNVSYTYYNNDGGDFHNNKNTNALSEACWYWSNYTSINGFHVTANYSAGTPTADCGYGGGMRIGPNTGQRTGTMMHEMNHGIGGGTIEVWGGWNESFLRTSVNGDWAGERANGVIRFWENRDDITITAAYDAAHWGLRENNGTYSQSTWCDKYAFNGSHLEAGNWAGPSNWNDTQIVYIGNSLIQQGMCEDGLVPINYYSGGFCLPAYVFPHKDDQKYYIKNEDESHGLYTSYLVESATGQLQWKTLSEEELAQDEQAAWYVSFTPQNQYYQIRNAGTGHYISYSASGSNGFKALQKSKITNNENFHVIRSRNDISVGSSSDNYSARSYWLIHPENRANPTCLTATSNNRVSATDVNLYDDATAMRWLFVEANQVSNFEEHVRLNYAEQIKDLIAKVQKLEKVPHTEEMEGVDNELDTQLSECLALADGVRNADEFSTLKGKVINAAVDFLSNATPSDVRKPFDLTFMVENAAIDDNTGWSVKPTFSNSCCEFYQTTFNFYQNISHLPQGTFKVLVQAFQRPGAYETAYSDYQNGTNKVNTVLYAGSNKVTIKHIADGARRTSLHSDDVKVGTPTRYIPNSMASAAAYFAKKLYDNEVLATTDAKDATLKIGLRGTVSTSNFWTVFDNFRLYFYGSLTPEQVVGINDIAVEPQSSGNDVWYTLDGRRLPGKPSQPGLYIVNGRKIAVR